MPKRDLLPRAPTPETALPTPRRAEEIVATLQRQIETGELPPGMPLDERTLTLQFGVSRTPVREALQQLAALELVRMTPRQGVTVAKLSVEKLRSMLEFISELEGVIATLAARRLTPPLSQALAAALHACEQALQAGDAGAYEQANAQFHDVIYAAARNDYLVQELRHTRRMIKRYRPGPLFTRRQMSTSVADHALIEEAIQAGDEAAAAHAAKRHVPYGNTGFAEFLALVPPGYISDDFGP